MASSDETNDRDDNGRFKPGNAGGPGGSRRRALTFRKAAEEAISEDHIEAIIRKATRMALEGNLSAMRFVIERVSGRVADAPIEAEPINIKVPRLRSVKDCDRAIESLIDGICKGTVDREAGKLLIDAVNARLKSIETSELEERLKQLENAAVVTQNGGHRTADRRFE